MPKFPWEKTLKILQKTAKGNPEKEKMLRKVTPELKEALGKKEVKRAFLFGSFEKKAKPGDMDILMQGAKPTHPTEPLSPVKDVFELPLHAMTPGTMKWGEVARRLSGKGHRMKRIAGIAPVAFTAGLLDQNDAEAMGIPMNPSRAGKALIGSLFKNKQIINVTKNPIGKQRFLLFDDGSFEMVDKRFVHDFVEEMGRRDLRFKYGVASKTGKDRIAKKNLQYHKAMSGGKADPYKSQKFFLERKGRLQTQDVQMADEIVTFNSEGEYFKIIRPVAERLERLGLGKILKRKKK